MAHADHNSLNKCKLCGKIGEFFCKECPSALCEPCRDKHDILLGCHLVVDIETINGAAFNIRCNSQCSTHYQPDIDSTSKSIHQVLEAKRDIQTTEFSDFKKRHYVEIEDELKRKENVLTVYSKICNNIDSMLSEDHAVGLYMSYHNLQKENEEFDDEILQDIVMPTVPGFDSESFLEDILQEICAKFDVRLINQEELEENQRRQDELTEENNGLKQQISELQAMLINEEEVDENQMRKDELSEENDALKQNISELQARNKDDLERRNQMEEHIKLLEKDRDICQQKVEEYEKKTNNNANISEQNQHKKELGKKTKDIAE
ncbi:unnamed protein product [Mytilus edulis]|uniref:B box-type domain-containing protein n=1 Tax=Mytilus edulis TaxID=6550 RepID=A0A8S3R575_MYTED|nr:unnamed protein product [Mytilus edulis]